MFSRVGPATGAPTRSSPELEGLSGEESFFYDDNFVVNKARTTELSSFRCAPPASFRTGPRRFRVDASLMLAVPSEVDHEFLTLMRQSGCQMVIGRHRGDHRTRGSRRSAKRQRVATIKRSVGAFHDHGIAVHGMFVAGLTRTPPPAPPRPPIRPPARHRDLQLMVETPGPGTRACGTGSPLRAAC